MKILLIVFLIILAIFLNSCGGVTDHAIQLVPDPPPSPYNTSMQTDSNFVSKLIAKATPDSLGVLLALTLEIFDVPYAYNLTRDSLGAYYIMNVYVYHNKDSSEKVLGDTVYNTKAYFYKDAFMPKSKQTAKVRLPFSLFKKTSLKYGKVEFFTQIKDFKALEPKRFKIDVDFLIIRK